MVGVERAELVIDVALLFGRGEHARQAHVRLLGRAMIAGLRGQIGDGVEGAGVVGPNREGGLERGACFGRFTDFGEEPATIDLEREPFVLVGRDRGAPLEQIGVEPGAAEALYQGLAAGGEAARFDLGTFHSYLERQAAAIRAKTGCEGVQFRLAREDGKLKLKARPIGASGP